MYKVMISLLSFRFVKVNVAVSPSPLNVSLVTFSKMIEKGSRCVVEPLSKIKESSVSDKSSSVPDSHWIPPPTILTKPLADFTSVSALTGVNVNVSPTSYFEPTSSTSIPLTEPRLI